MNFGFAGMKTNSYALQLMESNSFKYFSISTEHSIELKFSMHIISQRSTYCINFGEFRMKCFFAGVKKNCITAYGIKL